MSQSLSANMARFESRDLVIALDIFLPHSFIEVTAHNPWIPMSFAYLADLNHIFLFVHCSWSSSPLYDHYYIRQNSD